MTRSKCITAALVALACASTLHGQQVQASSTALCNSQADTRASALSPPRNLRIIGDAASQPLSSRVAGPSVEVTEPIERASGSHAYFEALAARPQCQKAYSLRDQAQLLQYRNNRNLPPAVTYDPANDTDPNRQDAAKIVIPNTRNNSLPNQVRLPIGTEDGNTYLITWDAYYTDTFRQARTGVASHKNWQLSGSEDNIFFETRARYDGGSTSNIGGRPPSFNKATDVASGDWRTYNSTLIGASGSNVTQIQPLYPQKNWFIIKPNTWTRHWIFIDQRAAGLDPVSTWMADENNDAKLMLDQLTIAVPGGSISKFWIEFNASNDIVPTGRVPMVAYARNIVVLKNIALVDVPSILQRPVR